ncbi:hypothetical protein [Geothrix alkalitolerans]|uniref:hypothetical protein n=1 Tax=Geothrix alkalitolerans TaxID=2922724 RepID=UPI001FAED358|nr:hypothetical protein [Geothrix alkalitolerans]
MLLIALVLLIPSTCNHIKPPLVVDEVWSATQELKRISLCSLEPGKTVEFKIRPMPNALSRFSGLGDRHFQASVVLSGTSSYMQTWEKGSIQIEIKRGNEIVPPHEVSTLFYGYSQTVNGPTGLSFDLQDDQLYSVSVRLLDKAYPPGCDFVFKPNWDHPLQIKDYAVGAMMSPLLARICGWLNIISIILILVSILISGRLKPITPEPS